MAKKDSVLRVTDTPGVFLNSVGEHVDRNGVAIGFKELKRKDTARFQEVLGVVVAEPADLLKAVALDPRFPMNQRIAAAVSAAPYFTAKRMSVTDGGRTSKTAQEQAVELLEAVRAMDESVGPQSAIPTGKAKAKK